jgi:bacterioferritin-associated ferredoxin
MAKISLSRERYTELLAAERTFHDLLPDIDKLEQCGEDCQAMRQVVQEEMARIAKVKQFFAPK